MLVMTTPGLNVLHIKRTKNIAHYCHIVHSITPMTYRVFGVDYFDSVLVANDVQADYTRKVWQAHNIAPKVLSIIGATYLDELAKLDISDSFLQETSLPPVLTKRDEALPEISPKQSFFRNTELVVLVSPSWGKETLLMRYGLSLLMPLAQSGFNLIIRPHPQSFISPNEAKNIAYLQDTLKPYPNVSWDKDTPNVIAFAKADALIGDFSSSIFDFICLFDKPVLSVEFEFDRAGYDYADIDEPMWALEALKSATYRLKESDFPRIKEIILEQIASPNPKQTAIKNALWVYKLKSDIIATNEILRIYEQILAKKISMPLYEQCKATNSALLALSPTPLNQDTSLRHTSIDSTNPIESQVDSAHIGTNTNPSAKNAPPLRPDSSSKVSE